MHKNGTNMKEPSLSIITVNFNNNLGLQKTIRSIQSQSYTDYEHIIIDANSMDGSKETITKYSAESSYLSYWVSEPDKGIYDGMNKGVKHAKGKYIYFLNSGDYLFDENVLASISFDDTAYICGNMRMIFSDTEYEDIVPPEKIDGLFLLKSFLPHPASFIHHSLFVNQEYRTDYRIISDWIHMVDNLVLKGCNYKHINILISNFDSTGLSSTNGSIGLNERNKWIKENIPVRIYDSLMELDNFKSSILGSIIPMVNEKRRHTQKRIKKIVLLLSKILK